MDQPSKLLIELIYIQNAGQKVIQSNVVEVNKVSELMINKGNVEELLHRRHTAGSCMESHHRPTLE